MAANCDHNGFHSGVGKLSRDFNQIRFVVVCDGCGEEIREVHAEEYPPSQDSQGISNARRAA
jgi:hypothetical protein